MKHERLANEQPVANTYGRFMYFHPPVPPPVYATFHDNLVTHLPSSPQELLYFGSILNPITFGELESRVVVPGCSLVGRRHASHSAEASPEQRYRFRPHFSRPIGHTHDACAAIMFFCSRCKAADVQQMDRAPTSASVFVPRSGGSVD